MERWRISLSRMEISPLLGSVRHYCRRGRDAGRRRKNGAAGAVRSARPSDAGQCGFLRPADEGQQCRHGGLHPLCQELPEVRLHHGPRLRRPQLHEYRRAGCHSRWRDLRTGRYQLRPYPDAYRQGQRHLFQHLRRDRRSQGPDARRKAGHLPRC